MLAEAKSGHVIVFTQFKVQKQWMTSNFDQFLLQWIILFELLQNCA